MGSICHADFVPYNFGIRRLRNGQADESGLFPVNSSDSLREQSVQKTIRLNYDPLNFQHLSLISRLFSPAFVNHSDDGDTSGFAAVIKALPHITFVLADSGIRLQFVPAEPKNMETTDKDRSSDLHPFIDAAPCGIKITWNETLMWRLEAESKIVERWQAPILVMV